MGLLSLLFEEPLVFVVLVGALLLTLSVHEFAHAYIGFRLGDPTAERMGRLTINPLAHIDPIGFLMVLLVGFGYAKPVPFNPSYLRDRIWGPAMIAAAGPFSNLLLGTACALIYRFVAPSLGPNNLLTFVLATLGVINFALMLFNLIPVPPLDGSKVLIAALSDSRFNQIRAFLELQGPYLLLMLILADIFLDLGIFAWIFGGSSALFSLISGA